MMDKLMYMKHTLMNCVENQMSHLDCVDTEELGDAIDMIKDLEEAIYYCTITEAMKGNGNGHNGHSAGMYSYNGTGEYEKGSAWYSEPYYNYQYKQPYENGNDYWNGGRMYFDGARYANGYGGGNGSSNGHSSSTGTSSNGNSTRNFTEYPMEMMRDYREGKSPKSRRMYMESKETHQDKATQMRELETYMQELTSDIVEMVEDASPEEKQYLSKRISTLATKIS